MKAMTVDPARVRRSLTLSVQTVDDSSWIVTGGQAPHTVRREGGRWRCDCTDSLFNGGRPCKHRIAAYLSRRVDSRLLDALREVGT
jgi:SWIM zinc finger